MNDYELKLSMNEHEFKISYIQKERQEEIERYEIMVLENKWPIAVLQGKIGRIEGIERVMSILGIEHKRYDYFEIQEIAKQSKYEAKAVS